MSGGLIRSRAGDRRSGECEGLDGLQQPRASAVESVVVRQVQNVDTGPDERRRPIGIDLVRIAPVSPGGFPGEGALQVREDQGALSQERPDGKEGVVRPLPGQRFRRSLADHRVPHGDHRKRRLVEGVEIVLQLLGREQILR